MTMTTIDLPQVGESVTEGTIQKWLKKPGDKISKYDPLVEVETDKVTMEVPSPVNGVMGAIIAQEGSTIPMGAPICEMETDEAAPSAAPASPEPAQLPVQPAPAAQSRPSTVGGLIEFKGVMGPSGVLDVGGDGAPAQAVVAPAPATVPAPAPVAPPTDGRLAGERSRLSPVVQKLASEHSVPLDVAARIPGTGVGGRVTKQDILKYIETRGAAPAGAPAASAPEFEPGVDEKAVPLTAVRRRIAENMTRALEIPVAWGLTEVDMTGLVRARERMKAEFLRKEGVGLTYLPFVLQAVAQAIKENPLVNSRWGGDHVKLLRRVNVGIAVAASQGLVVPVVHDADQYSVAGLAKAIAQLVQRSRDNTLRLEDVQGGTFTLNNTGVLGTVSSQPIINHPQVAILTTEAIVKRPVVIGDAIGIRSMMNICLSFDHRVMDGSDSVSFMQSVKRRLEAIGDNVVVY